MNTPNKKSSRRVLTLVALLVILAVSGAVGVSVLMSRSNSAPAGDMASVEAPAEVGFGQVVKLYFKPDGDVLPAESAEPLAVMAELARSNDAAVVSIVPYTDSDSDMAAAGLAQQRGQAVLHALEANGVSPGRIQIQPPAPSPEGDRRAAQRVDVLVN